MAYTWADQGGGSGAWARRVGCALTALTLLATVPSASATTLDPVAPGVPGDGRAWELVTAPEPVSARLAMGGFAEFVNGPEGVVLAIWPWGTESPTGRPAPFPAGQAGIASNRRSSNAASDGWSNHVAEHTRFPQFTDVEWAATGGEGQRAFDPGLTKVVWQNAEDANLAMSLSWAPWGRRTRRRR